MRGWPDRKYAFSINALLAMLGLGTGLVLLIIYSVLSIVVEKIDIKRSLNAFGASVSTRLADELRFAFWNVDYETMFLILQTEARAPEIRRLRLLDPVGNLIMDVVRHSDGVITTRQYAGDPIDTQANFAVSGTWARTITREDKSLGTIEVVVSDWQRSQDFLTRLILTILAQLVFSFAIVGAFYIAIRIFLVSRIVALQQVVSDFASFGFSTRAPESRTDEIGRLSIQFNIMASMIQKYSLEMEALVSERTSQLVEAEKLAFLGSLVAGIAHEINTPVGTSLTVITYLDKRINELKTMVAENKLTKVGLDDFLEELGTSTNLIISSLVRTSDLVRTFKGIGADQLYDDRRTIVLREYINEVIFSLSPKLRNTPHKIEVDCPSDLTVETYPSAIYQILTNLVVNSLIHGFSENQPGNIRIVISTMPDWLEIKYSDDGVGIPEEFMNRIFTPFFTTKRGQGGTGLGLYIIYTLIGKLHGTVTCQSVVGNGVTFLIRLPADIIRS